MEVTQGVFTIFMNKHILEIREFCRATKLDEDITDVAKALRSTYKEGLSSLTFKENNLF